MTESTLRTLEICLTRVSWGLAALLLNATVAWAQLPAPWDNQDVGSVGRAGSATLSSGVFTVNGSGADVWGSADGFHFVYQQLTGDGQIVARLDSVTRADGWSKAGVMMRDGLGPGEPHAFALLSPDREIRLQRRQSPGGSTASIYKSTGTFPHWVRLVRAGQTFRAYFSSDGITWTSGGSTTIVMGSTIYVGLAVTSHNQAALATAKFRNVSVTSTAVNKPPVVSLTAPANGAQFDAPATIQLTASASDAGGSVQQVQFFNGSTVIGTDTTSPYTVSVSNVPEGSYTLKAVALDNGGATASSSVSITVGPGKSDWLDDDIGSVGAAGSATFDLNRVTVRGAGADIWGTSDTFHFAYQTLTGDGEIVARVESLQATNVWAKAGVMMRESLSASSVHALSLVSASRSVAFQRRLYPGGTSSHTAGSASAPPRWVRLVRQGSTFIASESATGTSWTVIGSQTINMPSTLYVGLAVTSHTTGVLTTAVFSNVTIRATASTANQSPTVVITSPASGATLTAPATINIAASASDAGGSIAQVQFFAGSTLLGTDTTSPYTFSWTNVAAGSYSLKAVARDNLGATRTSAAVTVTVASSTGPPTKVVFTPSPDHPNVTYYLLEIYTAGSTPGTSRPVATKNLGKPAIVNGQITVDVATFIQALAPGSYIATVSAVNAAGAGRSTPPSPFVR
jgi:regulation of enolase protein 1 (concanavalin A-like superfamily)